MSLVTQLGGTYRVKLKVHVTSVLLELQFSWEGRGDGGEAGA